MVVKPVVLALSRSGEPVAHRVAETLGASVHGRAGRVDRADAYFDNALDHARDLFAAGTPIVGVCASGILIRGVAPLLADKRTEPPVISISDDGAVVVPLLGGHRGANRLAREISAALGATAAVTTAGDVALGVALDEPPAGYRLANPEDAKPVMAALLGGARAQIEGANPLTLDHTTGGGVTITTTDEPVQGGPDRLVYHPQRFTLGVGCARNCPPDHLWQLVEASLTKANIAAGAIAAIGTTAKASFTSQRSTSCADHPIRSNSFWAAGIGAVVNQPGACAWLAWPTIRARAVNPFASTASAEAKTSAAAPSEIDDEFAAVTVPSLRNAGFRCGIFSGRAFPGCSSSVTCTSPLRVFNVTAAISPSNAPLSCAAFARLRDRNAYSSCASRVS